MLKRDPVQREHIFRMLYYVRDDNGSESLQVFLRDVGIATGDRAVIRRTANIHNASDLTWALEALRSHLGYVCARRVDDSYQFLILRGIAE